MNEKDVVTNLVGTESEVHVFFKAAVDENLGNKAACMVLAKLSEIHGSKNGAYTKPCPHADLSCGGREFLPNGSRVYLDHGYLEYSTPECVTTADALAAIRAGDLMIKEAAAKVRTILKKNPAIAATRNNIDHRGHSFGTHVNVRMTREGYDRIFGDAAVLNGFVVPFFVSLPVICGSGRCSSKDKENLFQIWQRADFLEEIVGLQTTYARPLVNTRDESLSADPTKYARLHVIAFDANRMEIAGYLKLGLLRLLCAAIDADQIDLALELEDPLAAVRSVSRNPFASLNLYSEKTITALEIQREFLAAFRKIEERGAFIGRVPDAADILALWDKVLEKLEHDLFSLVGSLDWVTKYAWLEQIRSAKALDWFNAQMKWMDIQYHCLTDPTVPEMPCKCLITDEQVTELISQAPLRTRAAIRGKLLSMFGDEISVANWHYVVSLRDKIVYLLIDNPDKGDYETVSKAKTLKEATTILGLNHVSLDRMEQVYNKANWGRGPSEELIVNSKQN